MRRQVKILSLAMASGLAAASLSAAPKSSGNSETILETIVVTGDRYLEDIATSATKTATPAIETPMSIVTITRGQMDHQNSQTVSQALRYSSGVLSDVEATTRNDSVFLRGFGGFGQGTVVVNFMDGLKLPRGQAFAQFSMGPFLLERLEVVKGPSAVLYGQINPGGLVNQISRQPTRDSAHEIRTEIGSNDRFQAGITGRGTLDEAGNIFYSLTALGRSSGTRFDDVDEERIALAPSITWSPDSDTRLTINSFYTRDPEGGYFNSALARDVAPTAFKSMLDSKLNFGDPNVDDFNREQSGVGYQFTKRFDNLSFYSALRYAKVETDLIGVQRVAPLTPTGLLPRAAVQSDELAKGITFDNRLQIDLSRGGIGCIL